MATTVTRVLSTVVATLSAAFAAGAVLLGANSHEDFRSFANGVAVVFGCISLILFAFLLPKRPVAAPGTPPQRGIVGEVAVRFLVGGLCWVLLSLFAMFFLLGARGDSGSGGLYYLATIALALWALAPLLRLAKARGDT